MELIASTSSSTDSAGAKHHATLHRGTLAVDGATLADFRTRFEHLWHTYNAGLSDGTLGTTPSDIASHQQFVEDAE